MNKTTLGIIIAVVLLGGFVFIATRSDNTTSNAKQDLSSLIPPDQMTKDGIDTVAKQNTNVKRIVIAGHKIQDKEITIPVGTTVIFENRDSFEGLPYDAHTITTGTVDPSGKTGKAGIVPNSGSGVSDGTISAPLQKGDEFKYTFTEAGPVTFYIAEHPLVSGQGTITITATDTATKADNDVITMNSGSFFFAPNILKAKVGEEVNIDITSSGLHTFTIDELGVDVPTQDGITTRVTFTPDKAGTYTYYCAIPGHKEAGQIGTLTVTQ